MIIIDVQDPRDGSRWPFPRALQKVSIADQRREGLSEAIGADDAIDLYGGNPNPRAATSAKVTFRVTPRWQQTTFDALRKLLNRKIDHGMPQQLRFLDDDGIVWTGIGKLIVKDLDADESQQWQADWTLEWRLASGLLEGPSNDLYHWGQVGLKWGQAGIHWGDSPWTFALNNTAIVFTLRNADGDTETRDMIFSFTGKWGPQAPDGTKAGQHITVRNLDVVDPNTGAPVEFYLCDTLPDINTSITFDAGAVSVHKTGQPYWGILKRPDTQFGYMRFRYGDNRIYVAVESGAWPGPVAVAPMLPSPNGNMHVRWRAKKSAA